MKPFKVALCQVRAYDIEDTETNLKGLLAALDEAGRQGAQLVGLPECSYPAYYLKDADPYDRPGVRPFDEVCGLFAAKAKQHSYWLAAGMAMPHGPGRVTNSAIIFGPDGEIRGRYDKSFLWHFDTHWFEPGREFPTWDTGFCRFGALICADGRQPEIARSLAVNGAEVILDLTAWVSWARTMGELNTTQCEYLMPARAYENGTWVAAADKWGPEDGSIVYAGRSTVIGPDGVTRVCAPSDEETVVVFEIAPEPVETVPRRPALYGRLVEPTDSLAVMRLLEEPLVTDREDRRIAVVPGNDGFDAAAMIGRYEALRRQQCDLVVFAGEHGPEGWQVDLPQIEAAVRAAGGALAFAICTNGCAQGQSAVLVTPAGTHEHQATHGRGIQVGETPAAVIATAAGNVGMLCGDEGFVPEVGRCLALEGAEILVWPLFETHPMAERVARTRSDENRVYTAAAWPGGGMVIAPNGTPLTAVPAGSGLAMAAQVNRSMARWKAMAPNTHVIRDRLPEAYGSLVR